MKVDLLDSMGTIYNALGSSDKARVMIEQALSLRRARLPGDEVGMANTLARLADVETDLSHYEKAIALSEESMAMYRHLFGDNDERIAQRLAQISTDHFELDHPEQSESYEREAMTLSSRLVGRHDPRTLEMIADFGTILDLEGKMLEAEPYYVEYLGAVRTASPPNLPAIGDGLLWIGMNHYRQGRFAEAESELRNADSIFRQTYQDGHPIIAKNQAVLALTLLSRGKTDEALELSRQAVDADEKLYGPTHRETAFSEDSLGLALMASGRTDEARHVFQSDLEARMAVFPPTHIQIARTWMFLAMSDLNSGNLHQAANECRRADEILDQTREPHTHPQQAEIDALMMDILTAQQQYKEAEKLGELSVARFRQSLPPGNYHLASLESALGWALANDGKFDQATPLLRDALAINERSYGADLAQTARVGIRLAACLQASGHDAEARVLIRKDGAVLLASSDGSYRVERHWLTAHRLETDNRVGN